MLIVVEHRDLHLAAQPALDDEALGTLHVLEVDAAERRLQRLDHLAERLDVLRVHLDVEHVDVGELLEQDALALHHRLGGVGADVAESEHGGAVGDHGDEVSPDRVLVREVGVLRDLQAGFRDSGAVGERQIARGGNRLGRDDLDLSLAAAGMVVERVLP